MDTIELKNVKEGYIYNVLVPWGKGFKKAVGRLFRESEHVCENVYLICDDAGVAWEKPDEVIFLSEIGKVS
jgi:hypothetical protein